MNLNEYMQMAQELFNKYIDENESENKDEDGRKKL